MAAKLKDMFQERYYPRRNEFSRGRARNDPNAHIASKNDTVLHNPNRVFTPWQPFNAPQPPMNWVPIAQLPNINPIPVFFFP